MFYITKWCLGIFYTHLYILFIITSYHLSYSICLVVVCQFLNTCQQGPVSGIIFRSQSPLSAGLSTNSQGMLYRCLSYPFGTLPFLAYKMKVFWWYWHLWNLTTCFWLSDTGEPNGNVELKHFFFFFFCCRFPCVTWHAELEMESEVYRR
jgi:hypothetical protein